MHTNKTAFPMLFAAFLLLITMPSAFAQKSMEQIKQAAWKEVNRKDIPRTEEFQKASASEQKARSNVYYAQLLFKASKELSTENKNILLVEAKLFLEEAVALSPTLQSSYLLLGNVTYTLNKNYEESAPYYRTALKLDAMSVDANYNLGVLELERSQYDTAIIYLKQAIKIDNTRPYTYNCIAQCYQKLDSINVAVLYYEKAIELDSSDYLSLYQLGLIYGKKRGELKKCISLIQKAITINPNQKEYYEDLCVAYGLIGDYNAARIVGEQGIKKFPRYAPLYSNLAATYEYLNENKKKEAALKKVKDIELENGSNQ